MIKKVLKFNTYWSPKKLTKFVNENNIEIVGITETGLLYTLFYYEAEE